MRTLKNGAKLFSPGEKMPADMKGYRQSASDKYLWEPDPEPCDYRETRAIEKPCGNYTIINHCNLHQENVSFATCAECDDATTESQENVEQVNNEN